MAKRVFRGGAEVRVQPEPATLLKRATQARSEGTRAKYATAGLETAGPDSELRAMLLRQLYLSHMEGGRFVEALQVARAAARIADMPDVACQDVARALIGCDDIAGATLEMRRAGRLAPASRRSFHYWTLGATLYLSGLEESSIPVFEKAVRWGTTACPLYAAQLALAMRAVAADRVYPCALALEELRQDLSQAACGQGYGRFVLGEISHVLGDCEAAQSYLQDFARSAESGRKALAVGLTLELKRVRELLAVMAQSTDSSR